MNDISAVGAGAATQDLLGANSTVLGKDDFLKILVTQLRNQDPIKPVAADQFASQLAQFSSVEQLQNINSNLENSSNLELLLNQAINNTMATTLIGKSVRATGNEISLAGNDGVDLSYRLNGPAKDVKIVIKDGDGAVVRSLSLTDKTAGDHNYAWNGKDDNGDRVKPGSYAFSVEATDVEGQSVAAQTFVTGIIDSIRYDSGSAMLLIGDIQVGLDKVLEIGVNSSGGNARPDRKGN